MQFDGKKILADVLNIDISQILDNVKIGELEEWDSLGHMRLVLKIEKYLNRSITTEEIMDIIDIKSIESILNNN